MFITFKSSDGIYELKVCNCEPDGNNIIFISHQLKAKNTFKVSKDDTNEIIRVFMNTFNSKVTLVQSTGGDNDETIKQGREYLNKIGIDIRKPKK